MKLKKGDTIKVLIGKDKGKTGQIEKVYPARDQVLVMGVNEYKRHVKSRAQNSASQAGGQKSEIITITKPLPVSNVAMVCPNCKKVTRIGFKSEKGKKVRMCAKCKKGIN